MKLEICCYNVTSAVIAEQAGADRIELCASQSEGGITPSYGTLKQVQKLITIPVHPIVRPRGGDFCYSQYELATMQSDLALIKELGFPGVVIGVLNKKGEIDLKHLQTLLAICGDTMQVTFHRAFDMCVDPFEALKQLNALGIKRILTSGQQQTAEQGISLIEKLIAQSKNTIIMPGSGVTAANLAKFAQIQATEVHSSAGEYVDSTMLYRHKGVSMSPRSKQTEFMHYQVSQHKVQQMKRQLRN